MFQTAHPVIQDVSDTALWVAAFRAQESQRPDALFQDPLAKSLSGERGEEIARSMSSSRYVSWSVVIRTCIIDDYIRELVATGVDTVINLGCGLDTRPYRLALPSELRWIEVDFGQIIELKNKMLHNEKPKCRLERVVLDFNQHQQATALFARINSEAKNVVVLTEGVIPYLDLDQAALLAGALRANPNFRYWIVDYYSEHVARYMNSRTRRKQMQRAPFKFFPQDWYGFFNTKGWICKEMRYLGETSQRLGREVPIPLWAHMIRKILRLKNNRQITQYSGFALLGPNS